MRFCGQDQCAIDGNGRVKLSPHFLADFRGDSSDVVLHCLPEGALAIYPLSVWQKMRQSEPRPAAKAANSIVFRRRLRRVGAMTQFQTISNQGRLTIPPLFRPLLGLEPGNGAVQVGTEIGVEIWQKERWTAEFETLAGHEAEKADAEMAADLDQRGSCKTPREPR